MTNPLGSGTVNLNVNMSLEAKASLGRLACMNGISVGAYVRRLIDHALTDIEPDIATSIRSADFSRRMRRLKL